MLTGFGIPKLFTEAEVYHVKDVGVILQAHKKVFGLDIPMDMVFGVQDFQSFDHLNCKHENGFDSKPFPANEKQVFQGWTQHFHDS